MEIIRINQENYEIFFSKSEKVYEMTAEEFMEKILDRLLAAA